MQKRSISLILAAGLAATGVVGMSPSAQADPLPGSFFRVSRTVGPLAPNSYSQEPSISYDGRYVVFTSDADDIVPGDTNGETDVFRYDTETRTTLLVSHNAAGVSANRQSAEPHISGSGNFVVYSSRPKALDETGWRVYRYNARADTTTLVSKSPTGAAPNEASAALDVSGLGRFTLYTSTADNIVPNDTNGHADIFRYDVRTGRSTIVSRASGGGLTNGDSALAQMSGNGRFIIFKSTATDIVTGDHNGLADIFMRDVVGATNQLISHGPDGAFDQNESVDLAASPDGQLIAFQTRDEDLIGPGTSGLQLYLWNAGDGSVTLVSHSLTGDPGNSDAYEPDVDDFGNVVFTSDSNDLVTDPVTQFQFNVYRWDRATDAVSLVTVSRHGGPIDHSAISPVTTPDGLRIAFTSGSHELAPGRDGNGVNDVYLWTAGPGLQKQRVSD